MSKSSITATRWAASAAAAALVCTGVAVAAPVYADPSAGGTAVVTSLADSLDPGTLRSVLEQADGSGVGVTVQFAVTGTIQLQSPLPIVTTPGITIEGPGSDSLTIQAPPGDEIVPAFSYRPVTSGVAQLSGLTFAAGASVVGDFSVADSEGANAFLLADVVIDGAGDERSQPGVVVVGGEAQPDVLIANSTIKNHRTVEEGALSAAALISQAGQVFITESTFDNNIGGTFAGGLILGYNGSTQIYGSTFSNNSAELLGGAVFAFGPAPVSISQSTFSGNHSGDSGAALVAFSPEYTSISHSTITNNVSDGENGSAVIAVASQLSVDSSIISGNSGQDTSIPDLTVGIPVNQAVGKSSATALSDALAEAEALGGEANADRVAPLDDEGPSAIVGTLSFSLIGQPKASLDPTAWAIYESTIFEEPAQLGALANNGGHTLTHLPAATSPAINAGNIETLAGIELDQRNAPRVVGNFVDIGSVEVQAATPPQPPVVPDSAATAQLAKTGSGVELPLFAIAGLLLAGVALLGIRRRRSDA